MGRSRLRRGYSLEVIFEEDPDFCSHLDSLDSVAIRFGVKEADDTISVDSLVEEYQIRFQTSAEKEHVFRSLDGIWDVRDMDSCFVDWDEFSTDSSTLNTEMPPGASVKCDFDLQKSSPKLEGNVEVPQSGRRSRVSRRQIVEATWVFDSEDNDSGSNNDNESTGTEVELKDFDTEPEIKPVLVKEDERHDTVAKICLPIDIKLDHSTSSNCGTLPTPSHALFGNGNNFCRVIDSTEKDTLDSYLSTRTDETETNVYNFADSDHFNDSSSVASTAYESSTSTSSTESVCTVNGRSDSSNSPTISIISPKDAFESKFKSNLNVELQSRFAALMEDKSRAASANNDAPNNAELGTTDVKKVRALFENSCNPRKTSLGEESNSSSGSASSQRIYSKNPASPTNSNGVVGGVHKKLKQLNSTNTHQIVGKALRSAYSQFNLNQSCGGHAVDFAELLVNDRVVIEDSSDLFPTIKRHKYNRHKENFGQKQNDSGFSTLRRSRSMGTGISAIEASLSQDVYGTHTSKTNILAEEMPAPDTVKNVRTVFEQILKMKNANETGQANGCNSLSIVKKSLSSVKSNPSSKIYRSESMRDDFPSSNNSGPTSLLSCRRFGKPILMNDSSSNESVSPTQTSSGENKAQQNKHAVLERQYSEPIKFSPKINCPVRSRDYDSGIPTLTEEELFSSLLSSMNDDNPPKFVSPEVLQRIRSCGSTTTYFGGQVIAQAQSVKGRRQLPVSRRHTLMDFKEFNPADADYYSHLSNSSGFSNITTPTVTPSQSRCSNSSSRLDEYFTPPPIPTPIQEEFMAFGVISSDDELQLEPPKPRKLLLKRLSPDVDEDVYSLGASSIDTTPRIISVLPKTPTGSPTKSSSPVGSIIEGRGTPEGCEGQENNKCMWLNEISNDLDESLQKASLQDGNNNVIIMADSRKKLKDDKLNKVQNIRDANEGAWF